MSARSKTTRGIAALALLGLLFAAPRVASAGPLDDIDFEIRAGQHGDCTRGSGPKCIQIGANVDRTFRFQILFGQDVPYTTADPANQLDWNKVMGISTARIHHNSIRLGWRWLPAEQKVELGFYGYLKGQRISQALAKVDLGRWVDVEVRLHSNGLAVEADGVRYERAGSLGLTRFPPTVTVLLKTAYFGGDETAPHDMTIRVRGIQRR